MNSDRLEDEGIETALDRELGADLYVSLRRKWNPYVVALANYIEYEWSEIAPSDGQALCSPRTSNKA